jgi:hypothetical protein
MHRRTRRRFSPDQCPPRVLGDFKRSVFETLLFIVSEMNLNPYEAPSEPKSTRDEPTRVYRDAEDELLDNNTGVRILGSFALVIGSWIGYSTIYVPLNEALAQSQSIRVNRSMIVVSLASTICGAIMIVAGRHTRKVLMHRWYDATVLNVACTLALTVFTIAATEYFEVILEVLGYTFPN